jgi:hypothetical protein
VFCFVCVRIVLLWWFLQGFLPVVGRWSWVGCRLVPSEIWIFIFLLLGLLPVSWTIRCPCQSSELTEFSSSWSLAHQSLWIQQGASSHSSARSIALVSTNQTSLERVQMIEYTCEYTVICSTLAEMHCAPSRVR